MNSAIANVLNKVLGDWVQDLNSEQLNVSIFQGEVKLVNLRLKPNILHILGLPFNMSYGSIGSISVSIPWTSLLSNALIIEIFDVLVYCTPRDTSSWSEEEEKQAYYVGKKSAVDQFELFMDSELNKDQSSGSGYLSNTVTNIANNVQVKIMNFCFRYEDLSPGASFAFGVNMEKLEIFTCNSDWKQEFITSAKENYKIIKLKNFVIFCDFDLGINRVGNENIQENFLKYANKEKKRKVPHDYFLKPFSFEVKVIVSNRLDYKLPKINCKFESESLRFNFDAKQIRVIFQMVKFLDVYSKFKLGILQKFKYKSIDSIRPDYTDLYNEWKNEIQKAKKLELEEQLTALEKEISLADIRSLREEARAYLERRKTIEEKEKEIQKIEKEGSGTFNRLSGYFFRSSKEVEDKILDEKAARIAKVKDQISEITSSEIQPLILSREATEDEKSWNKFIFEFQLNNGEFTLSNQSNIMLSSTVSSLNLVLTKKIENILVDFRLDSFEITETVNYLQFYPKVFECAKFSLSFIQSPPQISIFCGDIYVCMIIRAFKKIYSAFSKELSTDIDANIYLHNANENINKRIEEGQKYLTQEIANPSNNDPLKLTLNLSAPTLVFPLDSVTKGSYLVINLGKVKCETGEIVNKYQNYLLHLNQLELFVVWEWEDIKKINESKKDFILDPSFSKIKIRKKITHADKKYALKLNIKIECISLNLDDKKLEFLFNIKSNYMIAISEDLDEKNSIDNVFKKSIAGQSMDSGLKFVPIIGAYSIKNTLTLSLSTMKIKKEVEQSKIGLPFKMDLKLKDFKTRISQRGSPLTLISLHSFEVKASRDMENIFISSLKIRIFQILDLNKDCQEGKVVSNPIIEEIKIVEYQNEPEGGERINTDSRSNKSIYKKEPQLKASVKSFTKGHIMDIGISLSDLKFTLSKSFIKSIISFYSSHIEPHLSRETVSQDISYELTFITNSRISINLKSIELELLSDPPNSFSLNCKSSFMIVYSTQSKSTHYYSESHEEVKRIYKSCTEDADLTLCHFEVYLAGPSTQSSSNQMIMPCRFSVDYNSTRKDLTLTQMTNFQVRIESICTRITATDINLINILNNSWAELSHGPAKPANRSEPQSIGIAPHVCMELNIETDSFQLTVIDDTGKNPVSLIYFQISNLCGSYISKDKTSALEVDVIMFMDYYNKLNGAWEPAIENCKLNVKVIIPEQASKKLLMIDCGQTISINMTQNFIEVLANLSQLTNYQELLKKESNDIIQRSNSIAYEIHNKFEIPLYVWISHSNIIIVEDGSPFYFSQEYVDQIIHKTYEKLKYSRISSLIKTPCKLFYSFFDPREDFLKDSKPINHYEFIVIDRLGLNLIQCKDSKNLKFDCLVSITSKEGKRVVEFQPCLKIFNHTLYQFNISCEGKTVRIPPETNYPISIYWQNELSKIIVEENNESLEISSKCTVDGFPIVIIPQQYKLDKEKWLKVIEISPEFYIKNSLFCEIRITSTQIQVSIDSEKEIPFNLEFSTNYQIEFEINGVTMVTEPCKLFHQSKFEIPIKDYPLSSIQIQCLEKQQNSISELSGYSKMQNKSKIKCWTLLISSECIIVNSSSENLNFSGLLMPAGHTRFYSGRIKSAKLSLSEKKSKSSSSFNIHTIGVSKQVKISQSKSIPKHLLYGVNISKAPGTFITKLIAIVPRFLIWNSLDIPIRIKQNGSSNFDTLWPRSPGFAFQFEDYQKSKTVMISDGQLQDQTFNWSAAFKIESIDDFNVKIVSSPTESEEKMNLFMKGWHIPSKYDLSRFVRIYVHTTDEATIHVVLAEPKEPDIKIINKSDFNFKVKQKKSKVEYDLLPDKILYWAWDNLQNKKILIFMFESKTASIDLDDFNHQSKKVFKQFRIRNQIVDTSREVIVELIQNEEIEEIEVSQIKYSKYATAKIFKRQDTLANYESPTKAPTGFSLFNLSKNQKKKLEFRLHFKEICISTFDKENNEMFLFNFREMSVDYRKTVRYAGNLIRDKLLLNLKIEHSQIDYMGTKTKYFPVIFFPVRYSDDISKSQSNTNEDSYCFFQMIMSLDSKKRLKHGKVISSADTYECLIIDMKSFHIKLNDEMIYSLLKFKDFFNVFSQNTEISPLKTSENSPAQDPNLFQSKSYFKRVSIQPLSFYVSFKLASSDQKANQKDTQGLFLINLITSLGGALVNINESPVSFNALNVKNSFMSVGNFISILMHSYQNKGISQFYKIFGSIDIIGNPMLLLGSICKGLYDFFAEPVKGIRSDVRGGFVKGIGKGVKSLMSGVIGGTFGSISKFSGSLYNIIKSSTEEKVQIKEISPNDIGINMAFGFKECAYDLAYGVANVAIKPYKGAKKKKAKEVFKGFVTGTFGLVLTPVKIVLRLTNVVSTTVASTSLLIARGKIQNFGRIRLRRYLGLSNVLIQYNEEMSQVLQIMKIACKACKSKQEELVYFMEYNTHEVCFMALITTNYVVSLIDAKVQGMLKIEDINLAEVHFVHETYFLILATEKGKLILFSDKIFSILLIYQVVLSNTQVKTNSDYNHKIPEEFWKVHKK